MRHVMCCGRYLLLSISAGCDPVNRLYYVELESLPRSAATGEAFCVLGGRTSCLRRSAWL